MAERQQQSPINRVALQREQASHRLAEWRRQLEASVRKLDQRAGRVVGPSASAAKVDRAAGGGSADDDGAPTAELPATPPQRGPAAVARAIPPWALVGLAAAGAYVWVALAAGGVEPSSFAAAGVVVWWSVLVVALFGAWPSGPLPRSTAIGALLLAILAALALGSAEWASDNGRAFAEGVRALGYLGLFALTVLAARAGGARALLGGLALGLVAVAVLALLSRVQTWTTGIEAELESTLPGASGRLSYPIGYWNGLAACMAPALCLLAWLGADARTRLARALAVAAFPLPVLVISLTASRGGLIAAACGLVALLALSGRRWHLLAVLLLGIAGAVPLVALTHAEPDLVHGLDTPAAAAAGDRVSGVYVVVALVLAALVHRGDAWLSRLHPARLRLPPRTTAIAILLLLGVAFFALSPGQRFREIRSQPVAGGEVASPESEVATGQVSGRAEYWDAALEAFRSEPLVGIGAGGFESWWLQNGELSQAVSNAHSLYIESLAELGIVGFGCVVGLLGLALVVGVRRAVAARRSADRAELGALSASVAVLLAGAVAASVEWTWEIPAAFAPVILAAAVLMSPSLRSGAEPGQSRRPRLALRALAVIAALAALAATGALFLSEQRLQDAESSLAGGQPAQAVEEARAASDLQPWAAEPYTQLALAEGERGRLEAARDAIASAIERASEDFSLYLVAARIEYRDGEPEAGDAALERARELAPRVPESLLRVAGARAREVP